MIPMTIVWALILALFGFTAEKSGKAILTMNVKSMKKTKIVIAGGGFAGLYAAKYFDKHLARRGTSK